MIYISKLTLPSASCEDAVVMGEQRTCFYTCYPFRIFPQKQLRSIFLDGITMFYGGNGSGKSTLINVIAQKLNALRYTDFNNSPFFDRYVDRCTVEFARRPEMSCVLTSDDVFEYVLNARCVNEAIDDRRNELIKKYGAIRDEYFKNPENSRLTQLNGLQDYERWSETRDILSRRKTQSSYVKKRVARDISLYSNGETAKRYFIDRIEPEGVYLLDEPENSLSIQFQIELAEYISATARSSKTQFIIATHSPIFLSMSNAIIYNLDSEPVKQCSWTELPNVRKYFDFFMQHRDEFK